MITTPTIDPAREESEAFLRLLSWVSPAFPTGGYAYSHGLEWAVETGDVRDVGTLGTWIGALLDHGSLGNDLIILGAAWDAADDRDGLREIADFACACASSRERFEEAVYQGEAFMKAASVWGVVPGPEERVGVRWPLPVAQGLVFQRGGVTRAQAVLSGGYGGVAALVSAAVRLVPLGQTDGLHALARLEPVLLAAVERTALLTLEDLGGACFRSDLATMHHETQGTRLFRT
ncbi:urease accessory protein UreF [Gluconacetobacter sacchari]|uniref:urease accessory protein UreF n=1 Tax=Gluconacetobacter sacchari TaxID=92759 RepID=UPI003571745C